MNGLIAAVSWMFWALSNSHGTNRILVLYDYKLYLSPVLRCQKDPSISKSCFEHPSRSERQKSGDF
jgi:hypothetical protein